MDRFTAFEYLCIDIANQYGLDKELFETRIAWTLNNIQNLEELGNAKMGLDTYSTIDPDEDELVSDWKESPLYFKAVMALRETQYVKPTAHLIGFDATCSGLQIMGAITGCEATANEVNLIDPTKRKDAYTTQTTKMREWVPTLGNEARSNVKLAVVAASYGSMKEPEKRFGEDTPELNAFYKAMNELFPGACELLEVLRNSWQKWALQHSWVLPDNHHVHVKVMEDMECRPKIDELGGASFTYKFKQNLGKERGVSNVAK